MPELLNIHEPLLVNSIGHASNAVVFGPLLTLSETAGCANRGLLTSRLRQRSSPWLESAIADRAVTVVHGTARGVGSCCRRVCAP
jgi:hypothetical protein